MLLARAGAKKHYYEFYPNRIEHYGRRVQSILYSDVKGVKLKRNIFDNLTGTGTIILSHKFKMKNIKNFKEMQDYINNLTQNRLY